jgi:hypothetical protein
MAKVSAARCDLKEAAGFKVRCQGSEIYSIRRPPILSAEEVHEAQIDKSV